MTEPTAARDPSDRKGLEARIPPPLVTLLIGLSMGAAAFVTPQVEVPDLVRYAAAGTVAAVGAAMGGAAFAAFGRARTTINPVAIEGASSLVTGGVYRLSRNPMYVGLCALLLTLAILLARPWLLVGPLIFFVFITRFQIVPEERVMRAKFGGAYDAYRARVRRWL